MPDDSPTTKSAARRWSQALAVALLVGTSIYVISLHAYSLKKATQGPSQQTALIRMEQAFRTAASILPSDERLGFYAGVPIRTDEKADQNSAIYYIAQHAVAPRVLVPDNSPRRTLVFLWTEEAVRQYVLENRLRVLAHPTTGIVLVERTTP